MQRTLTRNSSEDEIANVNFFYDDIVHTLQNTLDSCINSARDQRGYVLECRFTKVSEITQCNGDYAVQGHSKSPILVPIESSYATSYKRLILTSCLAVFSSYGWLLVKFSLARGECLTLTLSLGWSSANIAINDMSLKTFFGLHFRCRKYCVSSTNFRNPPWKLPKSLKLHGG